MKYFLSLLFLCFLLNSVSAQEKHFVFIESDTRQPFYVSIDGKIYSSSASGYVIIPKLAKGEYNVTIGFAANTFPEQNFKYSVGNKDLGFSLKNFGEKGWGLSDLQTMTVTMAGDIQSSSSANFKTEKPKEEYKPEISFERKKDLVDTNVPAKIDEQPVSISPPATTIDTTSVSVGFNAAVVGTADVTKLPDIAKVGSTVPDEQKVASSTNPSKAASNSTVKKLAEVKGNMGVYLTYVDGDDNTKDTIQVIIPTDAPSNTSNNQMSFNNSAPVTEAANSNKEGDLTFLNMEINSTKKDSVDQVNPTTEVLLIKNSNCINAVSEGDYNKLRRKIASQANEDDKMNEAKKVFKNKCFTTAQIKGLSTLFLSDESRYKFFDVSYNFVSDVDQYSSLEKELIDPYYISRFKAMLRH